MQATKTKSELTQTKQVQSVHAKDIDELKRLAGDNSALDDLKAEIAAVKKQSFEVSLPACASTVPGLPRARYWLTSVLCHCRTTIGCRRS